MSIYDQNFSGRDAQLIRLSQTTQRLAKSDLGLQKYPHYDCVCKSEKGQEDQSLHHVNVCDGCSLCAHRQRSLYERGCPYGCFTVYHKQRR